MSKKSAKTEVKRKMSPAKTPEERENQMISLAVDLAEQQLIDGTASSQIITHYLKLGSSTEKLEQELKKEKKELIAAKAEAMQTAKHIEELYTDALKAMRSYSGQSDEDS